VYQCWWKFVDTFTQKLTTVLVKITKVHCKKMNANNDDKWNDTWQKIKCQYWQRIEEFMAKN